MYIDVKTEVDLSDYDDEIKKYVKEVYDVHLSHIQYDKKEETTPNITLESISPHDDNQQQIKELLEVLSKCNIEVFTKELPIFIEKLKYRYIYENTTN